MKNQKHKSPIMQIFRHGNVSKWGVFLIVAFAMLQSAIKAATSFCVGRSIDGMTQFSQYDIVFYLVIAICIQPIGALLLVGENRAIGVTSEKMFKAIKEKVFTSIVQGKMEWFERETSSGDLTSRLNSDLNLLIKIFSSTFTWLLSVLLQATFAIVLCIAVSWQLSLIYFFILPISIFLIRHLSASIKSHQKKISKSKSRAASVATEVMESLASVKSFGVYGSMLKKYNAAVDTACTEANENNKVSAKLTFIKLLANMLQIFILFVASFFLVKNGYLSAGSVVIFISLSGYIREGFELVDYSIACIRRASGLSERILEIIGIPCENGGSVTKDIKDSAVIAARDMTFTYPSKTEPALKNIDLQVKANQSVGVIGESGSGKSTVIKLLCGFYDAPEGKLCIDDVPVEEWNLNSLRKKISLVAQEPFLFKGTIYENIACGRDGCTEEEVLKAVKDAQLEKFIETLPEGLNTMLDDRGKNLSGGQRQRICVARAMVRNAPIVLLDEATSALDPETEEQICDALDKLMIGRSAIIVTHKLKTVRNADYIYCLNRGSVIEEGTPAELTENKDGYYHQMLVKQHLA